MGRWYEDEEHYCECDVPSFTEVYARYQRGEVIEALYELEKVLPKLKDIHRKVVQR